jgi:hypothetical protein
VAEEIAAHGSGRGAGSGLLSHFLLGSNDRMKKSRYCI